MTLPQFSYPFIDEIKVTSYVNLEVDSEFLVEMAKTIAEPINNMTSNFVHMFDKPIIKDVDFSEITPNDIDVNVGN